MRTAREREGGVWSERGGGPRGRRERREREGREVGGGETTSAPERTRNRTGGRVSRHKGAPCEQSIRDQRARETQGEVEHSGAGPRLQLASAHTCTCTHTTVFPEQWTLPSADRELELPELARALVIVGATTSAASAAKRRRRSVGIVRLAWVCVAFRGSRFYDLSSCVVHAGAPIKLHHVLTPRRCTLHGRLRRGSTRHHVAGEGPSGI